MTWTTVNSAVNGFDYDASGDVTADNRNQYLYDAEGRICAVASSPMTGGQLLKNRKLFCRELPSHHAQ